MKVKTKRLTECQKQTWMIRTSMNTNINEYQEQSLIEHKCFY